MPSWTQLVKETEQVSPEELGDWLRARLVEQLAAVGTLRGKQDPLVPNNVLLYASGFLQKPDARFYSTAITAEDMNGLMAVIYGMNYTQGLTLVLHTPGGEITAAESFIEYMRSKFPRVEVIVPTYAMSAGTMIATSSDLVIMGRQSQLGPVDPQMAMPATGRSVSAHAIVEQFQKAKDEVSANPSLALAYAPILQSMGPALVTEANAALEFSKNAVASWLEKYMFRGRSRAAKKARDVAEFLNDRKENLDHGKRIDRELARSKGLVIENLEDDQALQEAVLTAYHLATIIFERTPFTKIMATHHNQMWLKGA